MIIKDYKKLHLDMLFSFSSKNIQGPASRDPGSKIFFSRFDKFLLFGNRELFTELQGGLIQSRGGKKNIFLDSFPNWFSSFWSVQGCW